MSEFSKEQLELAKKSFSIWQNKITKVKETLAKKDPLPKSQLTLAARNLDALAVALKLIEKELSSK